MTGLNIHFATKDLVRSRRGHGRPVSQELKGHLGVVDDEDGLSQNGDGADGACIHRLSLDTVEHYCQAVILVIRTIEILMLQPVLPRGLTGLGQVIDIPQHREAFRAWRKW